MSDNTEEIGFEELNRLTKLCKDIIPEDNWDNLLDMINDIREHAKNNGRNIIEEDRPLSLRLAWRCQTTDKTWSISVENYINQVPNYMFREAIKSSAGKQALNTFLNNK